MQNNLLKNILNLIALIGSVLKIILPIFLSYKKGRDDVQLENMKENNENVNKAAKAKSKIKSLDDDVLDSGLRSTTKNSKPSKKS